MNTYEYFVLELKKFVYGVTSDIEIIGFVNSFARLELSPKDIILVEFDKEDPIYDRFKSKVSHFNLCEMDRKKMSELILNLHLVRRRYNEQLKEYNLINRK